MRTSTREMPSPAHRYDVSSLIIFLKKFLFVIKKRKTILVVHYFGEGGGRPLLGLGFGWKHVRWRSVGAPCTAKWHQTGEGTVGIQRVGLSWHHSESARQRATANANGRPLTYWRSSPLRLVSQITKS